MNISYDRAGFASDNFAPVHPQIMDAMLKANTGHAPSYGADPWTEAVTPAMNKLFGRETHPFLMFNGTGSNAAALAHIMRGYTAVICSGVSHINTDETAAPERIAGAKLLVVPTSDGKLTPAHIEPLLSVLGVEHHAQPCAVCLTQATECGTVYTPDEVRAISELCHRNGLLVYMDGARIANAAAFLGVKVSDFTCGSGVDILCFGGTKNGMMYGECLIFFDETVARSFKYTRKSAGQLCSKQRYIAAQFLALLENDLWLENARHANRCAVYLAEQLKQADSFKPAFPVQANEVFFSIDERLAIELQKEYDFFFHDGYWRLVTSFDTSMKDIDAFVSRAVELQRGMQ